jgi:AcrR family transcriptional regulator
VARLSPAERREAIISAALRVAARKGLGATTAREVAAEMHTSSGLIHHYFGSMDDLLAATFDRAATAELEATMRPVTAATTPKAQLAAFFRSYLRLDEHVGYQLWLDAWSEAARRPALRATSRRLNVAWQECLRKIMDDGVTAGAFVCDDTFGASWRVLAMLDGLYLQLVAHPDTIDAADVLPWTARQTELELGLTAGTLLD